MNDIYFLLPLMLLMVKVMRLNGNMILDTLSCFLPCALLYCIPKFVVLLVWYRGRISWPLPYDPTAHLVSGVVGFCAVATLLLVYEKKKVNT